MQGFGKGILRGCVMKLRGLQHNVMFVTKDNIHLLQSMMQIQC